MLYLYQRTMFGKLENPKNMKLQDLNVREFATFVPLIILALWIGLYPAPFIERLQGSVNHVVARVSPQYSDKNAAADCGAGAPPKPELVAANTAARFLESAPCDAEGKPLASAAETGARR